VLVYRNGDKYEGDWRGGLRHGQGTLWVCADGRSSTRYGGDWADDLPEVRFRMGRLGWYAGAALCLFFRLRLLIHPAPHT